jgi:hypothetical protein
VGLLLSLFILCGINGVDIVALEDLAGDYEDGVYIYDENEIDEGYCDEDEDGYILSSCGEVFIFHKFIYLL